MVCSPGSRPANAFSTTDSTSARKIRGGVRWRSLEESPLACNVRDCRRPLTATGRSFTCDAGHAFDIARSGYVNLLQPQDRRSSRAGDSRETVEARARLFALGLSESLVRTLRGLMPSPASSEPWVVDLGCGSGDIVAGLVANSSWRPLGLDLSVPAVDRAARSYPDGLWVVANADRRLPLLDASVQVVLSVHARRNPAEAARILAPGGRLIVAIPAADDLIELRAAIMGESTPIDRSAALLSEHAEHFDLLERTRSSVRRQVGPDALRDLLRGTYRGERTSAAGRLATLSAMDVTLASDVFLLATRGRIEETSSHP